MGKPIACFILFVAHMAAMIMISEKSDTFFIISQMWLAAYVITARGKQ